MHKVARQLDEEEKVAQGCKTMRGGGEGCLRLRYYERRRRRLHKVASQLDEEEKVASGCKTMRGGGEGCLRLRDY